MFFIEIFVWIEMSNSLKVRNSIIIKLNEYKSDICE